MFDAVRPWLSAYLFTQVLEVPIYVAALWREDHRSTWGQRVGLAFGASAITHPLVWFVIPHLCDWFYGHYGPDRGYEAQIVVSESFAVVAEAFYFWLARLPRAFAWSFAANMASFGLGMLSRHHFGWP